MKKYVVFAVSVLTVLLFNGLLSGKVEAARVAVVPILVNEAEVERVSDFNSFYWDIMVERFKYPEYELMDDEVLAKVLPDSELKAFNKATLKDLAEKADAEIIIAMKLDKVSEKPVPFGNEESLLCRMEGEFVSYNKITGKYYNKKLNYEEEIEEVLTVKSDWQRYVFVGEMDRYINRTVEDNKTKKKF